MSLIHNSVSPKQVYYDDANVNKIYCDGKLVWEKPQPPQSNSQTHYTPPETIAGGAGKKWG